MSENFSFFSLCYQASLFKKAWAKQDKFHLFVCIGNALLCPLKKIREEETIMGRNQKKKELMKNRPGCMLVSVELLRKSSKRLRQGWRWRRCWTGMRRIAEFFVGLRNHCKWRYSNLKPSGMHKHEQPPGTNVKRRSAAGTVKSCSLHVDVTGHSLDD